MIGSSLIAPIRPRLDLEEHSSSLNQECIAIDEEEECCQRSLAHPYEIDFVSQSQEILEETQSYTYVISAHGCPTRYILDSPLLETSTHVSVSLQSGLVSRPRDSGKCSH